MSERRLQKRTRTVLPVKVLLPGNNLVVHTLDISCTGVRVGGLRQGLTPGQTVSLTRGTQKGQFRIVWVEQKGPHEFHAGLEAIQPQEKFWGVDLNAADRKQEEDLFLKVLRAAGKPTT